MRFSNVKVEYSIDGKEFILLRDVRYVQSMMTTTMSKSAWIEIRTKDDDVVRSFIEAVNANKIKWRFTDTEGGAYLADGQVFNHIMEQEDRTTKIEAEIILESMIFTVDDPAIA